jgi:hypothetical protein
VRSTWLSSLHYEVVAADGSARPFGALDEVAQLPGGPAAWSPSGRLAVVEASGSIALLGADGTAERIPLPIGAAGGLAWSNDGERLAIVDSQSPVMVVVRDGAAPEAVPLDPSDMGLDPEMGMLGPVAWSPDGRDLDFMANSWQDAPAASIWSVEPTSGDAVLLVEGVDGYRFDVNGATNPGGRAR